MNFKTVKTILSVLVLLFGLSAIPVVSAQEPAKPSKTAGNAELNALMKKAEQGDAKAQYNLGRKYALGEDVQKDYAEAVNWVRKAAEQENAKAQNTLGWMYANGRGVKKDYAKAVKWYRKAAEQGYADAQFNLGWMYDNGRGVKKDYAKAVKWYRKAADQGNTIAQVLLVEAQFNLGWMYDNGHGVQKDYAKAMKWYRKAAEQGNARAQYNLGLMYDYGQGVQQDYASAIKWYRKAAAQGHADAMFNLGVAYANGDGVLQSKHAAADWYYKAGIAYLKQGRKEDALVALDRIENTVPGHFLAKKLTQKIYGSEPQSGNTAEKQQTYFGTAWPVTSGYAVTNNHVIGEHYKITLVRTDGAQIPAVIVIRDKVNDIVLLKPANSNAVLPPALPISSNRPRIGANVFTVGYPLLNLMGIAPKLVSGHVNALTGIMDDPRTLQISVPVQAGNSGGPLLNMKGEVVGIVTYKLNAAEVFKWTGDLPQNVNYAIKANYIKSLVDSVPPRKNRAGTLPSKSGSLEDVADRVKNSVMIVIAK